MLCGVDMGIFLEQVKTAPLKVPVKIVKIIVKIVKTVPLKVVLFLLFTEEKEIGYFLDSIHP